MRRLVALAVGVAAIVVCVAAPAHAAAGDLDPTFGNGGTKVVDMGAPSELVQAVHALRSGRILIGGTYGAGYPSDGLVLTRLEPWGGLDQSFGSGGRVKVAANGFLWGDSAVQPDGKILLASSELVGSNGRYVVVRRFTISGAPDRQFGVLGTSVITLPGDATNQPRLAVASTGAIIVGMDDGRTVRVTRLTASGAIDRTFGADGVARSDQPEGSQNIFLARIALTASDAIVLGTALNTSCGDRECTWQAGVARLASDGSPDPTFAGGGYAVIPESGFDIAEDVAAGPDGTVYVAGLRRLFRLGADGVLDPSFGSGGAAPLVHRGNLDLAPDGRAVVAAGGVVSRFLADGTPDPSFGGGDGVAAYALPNGAPAIDGDVDVQTDGRVVVAGTKQAATSTARDAVVFRLLG
jgi:uncharacterized delta-60 repeat protein